MLSTYKELSQASVSSHRHPHHVNVETRSTKQRILVIALIELSHQQNKKAHTMRCTCKDLVFAHTVIPNASSFRPPHHLTGKTPLMEHISIPSFATTPSSPHRWILLTNTIKRPTLMLRTCKNLVVVNASTYRPSNPINEKTPSAKPRKYCQFNQ